MAWASPPAVRARSWDVPDRPVRQGAAAFQRYVAALVSIQDLSKDLAKSTEQLKTELTEGLRQTWTRAVEKTLEELGRLGEGLDQLTSADQVARAEQIADLARNQYQANLQYLQQIYSLQTSLNQSWKAMFLSFDEARAKQAGGTALGDFYQTQLSSLGEQLKGATSPEQVQQIMQLMQQYGTAYWQLYGNLASDFFREKGWGNIEQFLKDQQEVANTLLAKWAEEVKAKNEALLAAVQAVTDALNTETISLDSLNGLLDEEVGLRSELVYILNQEVAGHSALVDALNGAIAALGGFTVGLGSPAGPANANALVKHLSGAAASSRRWADADVDGGPAGGNRRRIAAPGVDRLCIGDGPERCVRDRLGGWRHHRRAPVRAHPDAGRGAPRLHRVHRAVHRGHHRRR